MTVRALSQLSKLASYAHLDIEGGGMDKAALRDDLGSILRCMRQLQVHLTRRHAVLHMMKGCSDDDLGWCGGCG
jgi:hypothetical protein